jgi:uncharacterized protein (TIGR02246 family)
MLRLTAALALALIAAPASAVDLVGPLSAADQQDVQATATAADANWNAHDAEGIAAMYADDATLVVGGRGPALQGRNEVLGYFTASFARTPATLRHTTTVDRLVVLAPDLVLADTRVALDDTRVDGSLQRVRDFNTVTVLVRQGDAWKFQTVRAYPVPPAAAPATAGNARH